MDWLAWHASYDENPALQRRMQFVRQQLAHCISARPPGEIRILSVCAGDGRDLLGVVSSHRRRADIRACLIEMDPTLVARGRATCAALGLSKQIEFRQGDATSVASYDSLIPADIVLMCGMLGLVPLFEMPNVVQAMRAFCAKGGNVVWTRRLDDRGKWHFRLLLQLMRTAGFRRVRCAMTSRLPFLLKSTEPLFAVSTHRLTGQPTELAAQGKLFSLLNVLVD